MNKADVKHLEKLVALSGFILRKVEKTDEVDGALFYFTRDRLFGALVEEPGLGYYAVVPRVVRTRTFTSPEAALREVIALYDEALPQLREEGWADIGQEFVWRNK